MARDAVPKADPPKTEKLELPIAPPPEEPPPKEPLNVPQNVGCGIEFGEDEVIKYAESKQKGKKDDDMQQRMSAGSRFTNSNSCGKKGSPMFSDAEDMKRRVRGTLTKPEYSVADFYHKHGVWRSIATNSLFEHTTLAVISVNAIWISVDTDNNPGATVVDAPYPFMYAEHFFCTYFSFEWFVRFMSFQRKRNGLKDAWFVFDSCLVGMMVFETWLMPLLMLMIGGGGNSALGNAAILRLLRLLRLSRLARMLRSMPELMILIRGMMSAARSLVFTLGLLFILIYIFAMIMRQITDGTPPGLKYFHNIPSSMYSLLLYGTFMDNIGPVLDEIGNSDKGGSIVYWIAFFTFLIIAAQMILNMLIGVVCEVVSAVAATEKEDMLVTYVKGRMEKIMKSLDENGDLSISKEEFSKILENKEACAVLVELGVDPVSLVDFADFIFDDGDSNEVELGFGDFMEVVMSFRGSQGATVKDIMNLMKITRNEMKKLEERVKGQRPLRKYATLEISSVGDGNSNGHSSNGHGKSSNGHGESSHCLDEKNWNSASGDVQDLSHPEGTARPRPQLKVGLLPPSDDVASTCVPNSRSHQSLSFSDEGTFQRSSEEAGPRTECAEALLLLVQRELKKIAKDAPSADWEQWSARLAGELGDGLSWLHSYNACEVVRTPAHDDGLA